MVWLHGFLHCIKYFKNPSPSKNDYCVVLIAHTCCTTIITLFYINNIHDYIRSVIGMSEYKRMCVFVYVCMFVLHNSCFRPNRQTHRHTQTHTHTHIHTQTHTFLGHTYFSWIELYWAISNTWTAQTHTHTHTKKNKNHCQLLLAAVACGTMCWSWMIVCCDNVSLYILPEFNHKPSITYQHSHTPAGHTSITHAYSGTQTVRGERKGKGAEGEKECANR